MAGHYKVAGEVGKLSLPVLRFTGLVCVHTTAGKTSLTSAFLFTPARVPAIRRFSLDLSLFGGFSRQAKEAASIRRVQVTVEEGDVEVKRVRRGTWGHSWTSQESPVPHTGLIVEFVGCLLWHQKRRDLRFFQGGGAKVSEIRAFFGKNRMLFMFLGSYSNRFLFSISFSESGKELKKRIHSNTNRKYEFFSF